jgi:hypothetical protein
MKIKSYYEISNHFGEKINNDVYDYSSGINLLKNTMSPYMFNNKNLSDFLQYINDILVNNIETVKKIRIHNNFTVSKNEKNIF